MMGRNWESQKRFEKGFYKGETFVLKNGGICQ
jgi:hypothetical protein